MRAVRLLLLCLVCWLGVRPAAAEPASGTGDVKAALEKFKQAQKRYEEKDYAAALELARAAVDATGSPNARLYVARALRELGQLPEAHAEMDRTLRDARDAAKNDPKYGATRDAAAAELALLDQRVGKVIVALADPPPGVKVSLNGRALAATEVGQPIAVNPGSVVASATGEGASPVEKSVEVAAGQTQTITLVFRETPGTAAPPPETARPKQAEQPKKQKKNLRTWGFVAAGVGVVGLSVFAVAGSMANSKYSELEDKCGSRRCSDPKYADTVDSGKRLDTIANVGLVAGGLGLLAGGALILFGGSSEESAAVVRPAVGGATVGLAKRF